MFGEYPPPPGNVSQDLKFPRSKLNLSLAKTYIQITKIMLQIYTNPHSVPQKGRENLWEMSKKLWTRGYT